MLLKLFPPHYHKIFFSLRYWTCLRINCHFSPLSCATWWIWNVWIYAGIIWHWSPEPSINWPVHWKLLIWAGNNLNPVFFPTRRILSISMNVEICYGAYLLNSLSYSNKFLLWNWTQTHGMIFRDTSSNQERCFLRSVSNLKNTMSMMSMSSCSFTPFSCFTMLASPFGRTVKISHSTNFLRKFKRFSWPLHHGMTS